MTAIILAAGYATRLHPYTSIFPKSLLKVEGKPVLEYTVDEILKSGKINNIYIVTNALFFSLFDQWLTNYPSNMLCHVNIELINDLTHSNEERKGTVGDLAYVIEKKKIFDDVMAICSDKLFTFIIADFIDFFHRKRSITNACQDVGNPDLIKKSHGCAVIDKNNRILEFHEKPENPRSSIKSIAFYIYPGKELPLICEYVRGGNSPDAIGSLSEWLCRRVSMYAWFINGGCHDIGNIPSYLNANKHYWAQYKGKIFRELNVMLLINNSKDMIDLENLKFVLEKISQWEMLTLVYICLPGKYISKTKNWLLELPLQLPVCLLINEKESSSLVDLVKAYKTIHNHIIGMVLDSKIRSFHFDDAQRFMDSNNCCIIENGEISGKSEVHGG